MFQPIVDIHMYQEKSEALLHPVAQQKLSSAHAAAVTTPVKRRQYQVYKYTGTKYTGVFFSLATRGLGYLFLHQFSGFRSLNKCSKMYFLNAYLSMPVEILCRLLDKILQVVIIITGSFSSDNG